jgi:hypothetical protein
VFNKFVFLFFVISARELTEFGCEIALIDIDNREKLNNALEGVY